MLSLIIYDNGFKNDNEQMRLDNKNLHKNSFINDYMRKHECNNLCKNGFMEDYQKVIFHEWMPYESEKFCKTLFCMKATNVDEYNLCQNDLQKFVLH